MSREQVLARHVGYCVTGGRNHDACSACLHPWNGPADYPPCESTAGKPPEDAFEASRATPQTLDGATIEACARAVDAQGEKLYAMMEARQLGSSERKVFSIRASEWFAARDRIRALSPRTDGPPATPREVLEEQLEAQLPTLPEVFMCPEHKATIIDEDGQCVYCDNAAPLSPNPDYRPPSATQGVSARPARLRDDEAARTAVGQAMLEYRATESPASAFSECISTALDTIELLTADRATRPTKEMS